jgi:hypothetical protein
MKITKEEIKALRPCSDGWEWYLAHFPNDENELKDIMLKLIDDSMYS